MYISNAWRNVIDTRFLTEEERAYFSLARADVERGENGERSGIFRSIDSWSSALGHWFRGVEPGSRASCLVAMVKMVPVVVKHTDPDGAGWAMNAEYLYKVGRNDYKISTSMHEALQRCLVEALLHQGTHRKDPEWGFWEYRPERDRSFLMNAKTEFFQAYRAVGPGLCLLEIVTHGANFDGVQREIPKISGPS